MTSVLILLSGFDPGTYFVEDGGIPDNGIAQLRAPDGDVIFFNIPTEFLTVTASAGRSVVFNLTESFGAADINVGSLTDSAQNPDFVQVRSIAGAGDVLLVSNGAISELGNDLAPDVVASTLILSAQTGVGSGNAIETQVGTIEAETVSGGISLANLGNVVIGGLTDDVVGLDVDTSGNLLFTSQGSITLNEASAGGFESVHGGNTSGNVTLVANGFDADIASIVDQDAIAAPGGDVTLIAGRDVALGTGGANFDNDIRARGNLFITAGRDLNVDGFADLASDGFGALTGGDVIVTAGRDINVLNSTGTDASIGAEGSAGGNTVLNAGAGGFVRLLATSNSTLFSSSGGVVVNTDRMVISATAGISADDGSVTITPRSLGWDTDLGSATDGAFALELSDAELDRIFTPSLRIGSLTSGPIAVTAAISPANAASLLLRSETDITLAAAGSLLVTNGLQMQAGDNIFLVGGSSLTATSFSAFVDQTGNDGGLGGFATFNGTITGSVSVSGSAEADTLSGSAANESLNGLGGADVLRGFGGNDQLNGGAGVDDMAGGLGNDSYFVTNGDLVTEAVGEGFDSIFTSETFALSAGQEIEVLATTNFALTTGLTLVGNELNNAITGNNGANSLYGRAGNDTLRGLGGNDLLDGEGGTDQLLGGTGNDTYFVTNGDTVTEAAGEGFDSVFALETFTLTAGSEVELVATSNSALTTAINLIGNEFNNAVTGNNGNNILDGGGGMDTLRGLDGNDTLDGGAMLDQLIGGTGNDNYFVTAGDVITELAGEGTDSAFASENYVLNAGASVELVATVNAAAVTAINLTGNALNNAVTGNAGVNILNGGAGGDTLRGLGGADQFNFTTALGGGNSDQMPDFVAGVDKIGLENAVFTGLAAGALAAGAFRSGAAATDADDRIIYNPATGALFFDSDGTGAAAQVQFATLPTGLAVASTDFIVF